MSASSALISAPAAGSAPPKHGARLLALDGIRGIAALSVMLYHLIPWSLSAGPHHRALEILALAFRPGWLGVDLFFVLSGFLITRLLLRDRGAPRFFRTFYVGRAFRILPCYVLVIAVMWFEYPQAHAYILLSLAFLANVAHVFSIQPVNGVLWSLAIEEHFYLVWPLAVRSLSRSRLISVLVAVCCVMPVARGLGALQHVDVYYYTWFRLDGLAWGGILALVAERDLSLGGARLRALGTRLLIGGTAVTFAAWRMGALSRTNILGAALQQACAAILFAAVLAFVIASRAAPALGFLRLRPLTWLGEISYGTYLIHMLVLDAYNACSARAGYPTPETPAAVLLRTAVCLGATVVLARMMSIYIERPATAFRRRLTAGPFSEGA